MIESFKSVPNYEGIYEISNLGNFRSVDRSYIDSIGRSVNRKGKVIESRINKSDGRKVLTLWKNNRQKTFKVAQLVAMTFLGHVPCGHTIVVDHIDNDKLNDRLDNLQLINSRENTSKDRFSNSGFTGVSFHKSSNKWQAKIRVGNKQKYLGVFEDKIKASEAYQKELLKLK